MKNLKITTTLLLLLVTGYFTNLTTYASDDYDWDDLDVNYSYDYYNQELDVELYLETDESPDDSYSAEIEINDEEIEKDLVYSSSSDKFYTKFSIDINEKDLEENYDIDVAITNEEDDDEEFDDTLNNNVSNYFEWEDLEVDATYYEDDEYLLLTTTVDLEGTVTGKHYLYLEFDDKSYVSTFFYSSTTDTYTATTKIYIDEDDIEYDYNYEFSIKNKSGVELYEDDGNVDVEYEDDAEDLDWSDLDISTDYDEDDEELALSLVLDDVENSPEDDYSIKVKLDGSYYTKDLIYSTSGDKLYANLTIDIDEDDIESYYYINYYVINEDDSTTEYTKTSKKITVDYDEDEDNEDYGDNYSANALRISQSLIMKVESRYSDNDDRVDYLEILIDKLEDLADSSSKYEDLVDELVEILNDKIDYYENNDEDDIDLDSLLENGSNENLGQNKWEFNQNNNNGNINSFNRNPNGFQNGK